MNKNINALLKLSLSDILPFVKSKSSKNFLKSMRNEMLDPLYFLKESSMIKINY